MRGRGQAAALGCAAASQKVLVARLVQRATVEALEIPGAPVRRGASDAHVSAI